jgi:alpha-dioxygenase
MDPVVYNDHPCPELVARVFFERNTRSERFVPGANLFVAAWIQFMIHDWFEHKLSEEKGEHGVNKTAFVKDTSFTINTNSHFWDGSQIYKDSLRMKDGSGKLRLGNDGYLPLKDNKEDVGNGPNRWYGVMLLHLLFTKEHNYICEVLKSKYPDLNENELYGKARLIVTALIAKIHTIEWTPVIIGNKVTIAGQNLQYNGLLGSEFKQRFGHTGISLLSGYPQGKLNDQGVNFSHLIEFSSIYRMHSLLPEHVRIEDDVVAFEDTLFDNARIINTKYKYSHLYESMGRNPCTSLDLNNYPSFLRKLPLSDGKIIDLAVVDIYRDRERCIPRYNEFRRNLLLHPIQKWEDLTKDKIETCLWK